MAKPTTEQLQTELEQVVNKYNQAQETIKECQTRLIQLDAIIKDRLEN